jgi:hypothetical protein
MRRLNQFVHYIPQGILVASLGWVYLATISPGLTWANNGSDGGDLIAAAATGGVPHPTGYPVYLLLASLFQQLPVGSLAFRTNLMSALATICAAVMVYELVTRFLSSSGVRSNWLAGLASAFAFGLSSLIWSQAVITEVYALHALFIVLILYLSAGLISRFTRGQLDCLTGLIFGLAMGNHVTTIFLLPIVFAPAISRVPHLAGLENPDARLFTKNWRLDLRSMLRRFAFMNIGLLAYIIIPLRALSQPPVNWGNPVTLNGFGWLVSGRLYQHELMQLSLASAWERTQSAVTMLLGQFGVPGLFVGLIGLIVFFSKSRLNWNMIWLTLVSSIFAIGYGTWDSFVYLMPAFLCFSVWIGIGVAGLMEMIAPRIRAGGFVIGLVFISWLFILAANSWPSVDASQDRSAEEFGKTVLAQVPDQAIVFTKGDDAVFALWYFHYALGQRPDIVVVASDLLHHDWYQQTLQATYPSLSVPGPFPFEETIRLANPSRPACYVEYAGGPDIQCLAPAK